MAIDTSPFNGAPLYLRDSQWAQKFFGGAGMANQPKRKFTFVAGLIPHSHPVQHDLYRDVRLDNIFLLKSFDPPKFEFDTELLNQYNKKRVVQTRINYTPVSMRFHDDVDNKIYQLIVSYIQYYYKDSLNAGNNDWNVDTVRNFIKSRDWGFSLDYPSNSTQSTSGHSKNKYFFEKIFVAWVNAGRITFMFMQHPLVTDITLDTLDYADGGTPLEISLTFMYEGVIFKDINTPITDDSDLVTQVRNMLTNTEDIGQPFIGPNPNQAVARQDRAPGIGELVSGAQTFYGKYNNKPTIEDAIHDFVIRPAAGQASGSLGSWGNFNFGGTGSAKSPGLYGGTGDQTGQQYQYVNSGDQVTSNYASSTGKLSDSRANTQFLSATGAGDKI